MKKLLNFCNPKELWTKEKSQLGKILEPKLLSLVLEARSSYDPDLEMEKLGNYDVGYVTMYDKEYPALLKEVFDCPAVLYVRGDIKAISKLNLAVVGSRKYTNYGHNAAYRLSYDCAANGLTIVSGLALGIDAAAHRAALDAGGLTVGVLGCGLDRVYPVSNFALGQEIVEKGGAIISEFPLGVPPMKQNFPLRNRIIAGVSRGTLVIEAALHSGALITAYQALEYNRDVFAVPGNVDSETSAGTNQLIKNGAKLIVEAKDVLDEFQVEATTQIEKVKAILPETEEEKLIVEILRDGEKSGDEIINASNLSVVAINSTLSILEMKGVVQNVAGRYGLK